MINFINKLRLKNKLLFYVLFVFTLVYGITLLYISLNVRAKAFDDAVTIINTSVMEHRNLVRSNIMKVYNETDVIRDMYQEYPSVPEEGRDKFFNELLRSWLENNPNYLSTWQIWELNEIDPTYELKNGRRRNVFYRKEGKIGHTIKDVDMTNKTLTGLYYDIRNLNEDKIQDPYYDDLTIELKGILMTSVVLPIRENGKFQGLVGVDISLANMGSIITDMQPFEGAESFFISPDNSIVAHTNSSLVGKKLMDDPSLHRPSFSDALRKIGLQQDSYFQYKKETTGEKYYTYIAPIKFDDVPESWAIGVEVPVEILSARVKSIFYQSLLIGILGLAVLYAAVYLIATNIVKPVNESVEFSERIASGDLTSELDVSRHDEVGDLGRSLQLMATNVKGTIHEIKKGCQCYKSV